MNKFLRRLSGTRRLKLGHVSIGAAILTGAFTANVHQPSQPTHSSKPEAQPKEGVISSRPSFNNNVPFRSDLPTYTRDEISKHFNEETRIWVTYRNGVYDVTDFRSAHPGRSGRIEMVGGQDLEPWWRIYRQHYRGHIVDFLEENFRIGNVEPSEVNTVDLDSIYNSYVELDPPRHKEQQVCTFAPYCSEAPMHLWTKSFFTPNELFYTRNHAFVPDMEPEDYELEVVVDGKTFVFTLEDLKTKFPEYEVATVVQCAANRSEDYHGKGKGSTRGMFNPPHWNGGAFSCAKWGGARMRDILAYCGVPVNSLYEGTVFREDWKDAHLKMIAFDDDETGASYGASTFLDKVLDPHGDCLVAYHMNGRDLPRDHGYPCRAIIPGHAGARQPKWLGKIEVIPSASNVTQCLQFDPSITFEEDLKTWPPKKVEEGEIAPAAVVQEMPVQSFITIPRQNGCYLVNPRSSTIHCEGVAWSGGGHGIHRVDVSPDGGDSFSSSKMIPKPIEQFRRGQWSWQFFEKEIELTDIQMERLRLGERVDLILASKAVDAHFNVQPESYQGNLNPRGVAVNHWYKVHVTLFPHVDVEVGKVVDITEKLRRIGTVGENEVMDDGEEMMRNRNRPSGGEFADLWNDHGWRHPYGFPVNGVKETASDWTQILNGENDTPGLESEIDWEYYQSMKCQPYYWTPGMEVETVGEMQTQGNSVSVGEGQEQPHFM